MQNDVQATSSLRPKFLLGEGVMDGVGVTVKKGLGKGTSCS